MKRVTLVQNKNTSGYFIIEAVVGISIIVVALLGIISLLTQSLSLNRLVADQYVANGLAAEGIELVKNIIDANCIEYDTHPGPWNQVAPGMDIGIYEGDYNDETLTPIQNRFLRFDPVTKTYGYDSGGDTKF